MFGFIFLSFGAIIMRKSCALLEVKLRFIKAQIEDYRSKILLGQFFKLIEAVLELFIPIVMADLIDVGIRNSDRAYIFSRAGLMLLLAFVGLCSALICQYIASRFSFEFSNDLRLRAFRKIQSLSTAEREKIGTSSLNSRLINDIGKLQEAFAMLIRLVVRAPFLAIGSIIMAIRLNLSLSAVFIVASPLIALTMLYILRLIAPNFKELQAIIDGFQRLSLEAVKGARFIRALSKQGFMQKRFEEKNDSYTTLAVKTGRLSALLSPATSVIMNIAVIFVILLAFPELKAGRIKIGIVLAFIQYLAQILLQTNVIASLAVLYTNAYASANRLEELMESEEEDFLNSGFAPNEFESLEFSDVAFSYDGSVPALCDISFSLKKGESLGIIGGTGSGKTSLAGLIMRLYEKNRGSILLNSVPIEKTAMPALRKLFSLAMQKNSFLNMSIRENLQIAQNSSEEELLKALDIADCGFVFEKQRGLDELVLEDASNFSGGQKQRLNIARCFLSSKGLNIFDDCFSALDYATEKRLRQKLKENQGNRAYIFISQRISGVMGCDKILVLDKGRAQGLASHEELLEKCSVYREIALSQQMEETL